MDMTAEHSAARLRSALDRAYGMNWQPEEVAQLAGRRLGPAVRAAIEAVASDRHGTGVPAAAAHLPATAWAQAALLVSRLPSLPPVGATAAGGRSSRDDAGRVLSRVRALLAKAESTTFPEEAEALTAKAQELIARHSIDEAMLLHGRKDAGPVTNIRIWIDDPYATAKSLLLTKVAGSNRCTSVWSDGLNLATVFGNPADLEFLEVLFTSLLVQATSAVMAEGRRTDSAGRSRTRSFRQAFLVSFAVRIGERLADVTHRAEQDAATRHGPDLLPVLASRAEAGREAAHRLFPGVVKRRPVSASNYAGWVAGRSAADEADVAGSRLPAASGE